MNNRFTNWHDAHKKHRSLGAQFADLIARAIGSWPFLITQTIFVVSWITLNILGVISRWDPWPFILLNLLFSLQAAYAAPIIMMAQNRQVDRDRHHAEADYQTNLEAKREIEDLQMRLGRIEEEKLNRIIALLENKR